LSGDDIEIREVAMETDDGGRKTLKRRGLKYLLALGAAAVTAFIIHRKKPAATPAPAGEPRERLVVRDVGNLRPLGLFFQAMILNLLKDPRKVRIVEKMRLAVAIAPTGYEDNALTMTFANGQVILENGVSANVDIKIMSDLTTLMKLARMPAGPAAVKFLQTHEGKDLISKMLSGELKIKGVVTHPFGMMKFGEFLAPVTG
jgi:hypothetical protein